MNIESEQNTGHNFEIKQSWDNECTTYSNQRIAARQTDDKRWNKNVSVEGEEYAH